MIIESFVSISGEHVLPKLKTRLWEVQATLVPTAGNVTVYGYVNFATHAPGPERHQPLKTYGGIRGLITRDRYEFSPVHIKKSLFKMSI